MSKFKKGDKVVCTLKERPDYFVEEMDYMLDREEVLEVESVYEDRVLVFDKEDVYDGWYLRNEDIELYAPPIKVFDPKWLRFDKKISGLWHYTIDEYKKQLPHKVAFNYDKKRTTLMFNGGEVVRTDTHKTDTYNVWFGFLIGIVKHLSDDKVKYKRFIEQLYSYPKMRRETALEFYVYNLLSDTLSNHQFNKLKDRIKNIKFNNEIIKFKDFDLEVITKGLLPF